MYEELIKRLRECTAEMNGEKTLWHQAADAIEDLQKQLREEKVDNINLTGWLAEEHAKHLWIPVTERLPEPNQLDSRGFAVSYLVMNGHKIMTARRTEDYWVLFGQGVVLDYVTHWMPLPKPPKEET